ncbi:hypothetical protein D3C81_1503450 [compost metagenome]
MIENADTILAHAKCMGGIVDDLQPVRIRHSLNALNVARYPVTVHRQDRGGGRRDRLFDPLGVEVLADRVDVHENRFEVVPEQRMRGSHKRIRGGDHFTGNAQRLQRRHQRQRAVAEQ